MQRSGRVWSVFVLCFVALLLAHLAFGGVFGWEEMWRALTMGPGSSAQQAVLWDIRLPRALAAVFVGANLAVVGAAFQALFRNPLADPFIIGVSSAAAVGGAIATLLGLSSGLPATICASATALLGLLLVLALGGRGKFALSTVLVAGAAVGSFLWALVTFVLARAGQDSGKILDWLLGSLVGMDWTRVAILAGTGLAGLVILITTARPLTLFAVGEDSAKSLGVDVKRLKWTVLITGTVIAGATVASVGIVGFVGLFTPHIARRLVGPSVGRLLPASAVLGASGVLLADLVAQRALPGGLNLGVVTALIGAPFLMVLLRKRP